MESNILNKELWTDITRLKLLNKLDAPVRFLLHESPFDEVDDAEGATARANRDEYVITGRILPNSGIYREGAYLIEIKLTKFFPIHPPEVRFLTPIYHPNVGKDGTFCNELLQKISQWTRNTSLTNVIRAVTKHIDHPDIDFSINIESGKEYMENRSEFDRKAMEYVKKHALPRF